ncbi:MAG TPA: aminotransferase class V-fold PLP-dependent enzyme [Bryobacteraceae bacterium]|nr:aminotransferase class V-fold PLP-dependent enzyme [Bryobacteraceae bacterium]
MALLESRRVFLHSLGPGVAALQLRAATVQAEPYWALVRSHFAFTEQHVPMNAANLCPSPAAVSERVAELTRDIDMDCGFQNRAKFEKMLEDARARVAAQLGVAADEIALVRNTSEANNIVNNGVPLKAGDEVIIWDQNHPTNNVAWDVRAARFGLSVRRVMTPPAPKDVSDLIAPFERALSPRTRVLSITHLSNTSGIRLPVRELCELGRRRGLHVHVDGAQAWGALDVNLRELGCDSWSGSAHKWFMGPREVGLLYVRKERIAAIWPNTVAPGWGNDAEPDVAGARKFESLGQRDDARLAALRTAADFRDAIGGAKIEARVLELASVLKERIAALDLPLATPRVPALSGGVCVIRAKPDVGRQAYEALYSRFGIACAATGGLRLCPHIYNTMDHIERAAAAVRAVRHLLG